MRSWLVFGLLAAIAAAPLPARASDDVVHFFSNIHVTAGAPVKDAVCFFCSVRDNGAVTGDIVAFFGSVHITGDAQHDVVDFFGNVRADDNATIENDLVSIFSNVRLGENVTVGRDTVSIFGVIQAPASAIIRGDRVSVPVIIFYGPLLLIVLVVLLVTKEIRANRRRWLAPGVRRPPVS